MRPLPFVIGNDIVNIGGTIWHDPARVFRLARRILHPRDLDLLRLGRAPIYDLFASDEQSELFSRAVRSEPDLSKSSSHQAVLMRRVTAFVAGRFAAKEAAKKAWSADMIGFKDVTVVHDTSKFRLHQHGSPAVKLLCQPQELVGTEEGLLLQQEAALSISHDGSYVIASVIAEPLRQDMIRAFQKWREKHDGDENKKSVRAENDAELDKP